MNAFVRRLAVLSVLWSLCELLLPEGRQQPMVRMTMSVLVMTALLSSAGEILTLPVELPAWTEVTQQAAEESYHRTALSAMANQVESYCVHQAQRAGYQATAAVWLRMDGSVESIEVRLMDGETPLLSPEKLRQHLAAQLSVDMETIRVEGV